MRKLSAGVRVKKWLVKLLALDVALLKGDGSHVQSMPTVYRLAAVQSIRTAVASPLTFVCAGIESYDGTPSSDECERLQVSSVVCLPLSDNTLF